MQKSAITRFLRHVPHASSSARTTLKTRVAASSRAIASATASVRTLERECFVCGQTGHPAHLCPSNPNANKPARTHENELDEDPNAPSVWDPDRGLKNAVCFLCKKRGHLAAACPTKARVCWKCNQPGHLAAYCTNPRDPSTLKCYNCEGTGHRSRDCPEPRRPSVDGHQVDQRPCYRCGES
ncbi:hypothetical protein EXIGLDRAFT_203993, partial [Exidia glandulosa HHB12029]